MGAAHEVVLPTWPYASVQRGNIKSCCKSLRRFHDVRPFKSEPEWPQQDFEDLGVKRPAGTQATRANVRFGPCIFDGGFFRFQSPPK